MLGTYHLNALFDTLREIHFQHEAIKLWQYVLEQACKTLQSEAGTFYGVSMQDPNELQLTAAFGENLDRLSHVPFTLGKGICGWVAQYQQPALVNDVRQDPRFNAQVDLMTGFKTKSILCVPVFDKHQTYGVVEILNKKTGPFLPQDQEFMTLLGRQTAVAYRNIILMTEIQGSKVLMESVLAGLSGGLIAVDSGATITLANAAAQRILHLPADGLVGKPVRTVLSPYPELVTALQQTFQSGQALLRQETQVQIDAVAARIGYSTLLIQDPAGKVIGSGMIFQTLS